MAFINRAPTQQEYPGDNILYFWLKDSYFGKIPFDNSFIPFLYDEIKRKIKATDETFDDGTTQHKFASLPFYSVEVNENQKLSVAEGVTSSPSLRYGEDHKLMRNGITSTTEIARNLSIYCQKPPQNIKKVSDEVSDNECITHTITVENASIYPCQHDFNIIGELSTLPYDEFTFTNGVTYDNSKITIPEGILDFSVTVILSSLDVNGYYDLTVGSVRGRGRFRASSN